MYCIELGKEFSDKKTMLKALKDNEHSIIATKCAKKQLSASKGQFSVPSFSKVLEDSEAKQLNLEEGFVYPVINTTKYLDSHRDVHFDGIWDDDLVENGINRDYLNAHKGAITDVIAWGKNVEVLVKMIPWSFVGKDYDGETQALIFKIKETDILIPAALEAIKERIPIQGSVGMYYDVIKFAVDDDDPYYALNKEYYDKMIVQIANRDEVEKIGYFYGVEKARIDEGSMVRRGSNDATQIIYPDINKDEESDKTLKNEDSYIDSLYDSITNKTV